MLNYYYSKIERLKVKFIQTTMMPLGQMPNCSLFFFSLCLRTQQIHMELFLQSFPIHKHVLLHFSKSRQDNLLIKLNSRDEFFQHHWHNYLDPLKFPALDLEQREYQRFLSLALRIICQKPRRIFFLSEVLWGGKREPQLHTN